MTRIRLEYHGHVAYITLDHPPANTWTLASLQAFLQMMVELDSRPDVVALVIRGAGAMWSTPAKWQRPSVAPSRRWPASTG